MEHSCIDVIVQQRQKICTSQKVIFLSHISWYKRDQAKMINCFSKIKMHIMLDFTAYYAHLIEPFCHLSSFLFRPKIDYLKVIAENELIKAENIKAPPPSRVIDVRERDFSYSCVLTTQFESLNSIVKGLCSDRKITTPLVIFVTTVLALYEISSSFTQFP